MDVVVPDPGAAGEKESNTLSHVVERDLRRRLPSGRCNLVDDFAGGGNGDVETSGSRGGNSECLAYRVANGKGIGEPACNPASRRPVVVQEGVMGQGVSGRPRSGDCVPDSGQWEAVDIRDSLQNGVYARIRSRWRRHSS